MNKRVLAIVLVAILALGLLAGCKKHAVSKDAAIDIAMNHLKITREQVSSQINVKIESLPSVDCYVVTFTYNNTNYYYQINAETGFIVFIDEKPLAVIN